MNRKAFLVLTCSFVLIGASSFPVQFNVKVGYAQIEFYLNQPLANAKGGLVPITFDYDPEARSLQVPSSLSYPLNVKGVP